MQLAPTLAAWPVQLAVLAGRAGQEVSGAVNADIVGPEKRSGWLHVLRVPAVTRGAPVGRAWRSPTSGRAHARPMGCPLQGSRGVRLPNLLAAAADRVCALASPYL